MAHKARRQSYRETLLRKLLGLYLGHFSMPPLLSMEKMRGMRGNPELRESSHLAYLSIYGFSPDIWDIRD